MWLNCLKTDFLERFSNRPMVCLGDRGDEVLAKKGNVPVQNSVNENTEGSKGESHMGIGL